MDSFKQAQQDMNKAYFYGVPGIICSGTVWLVAGLVAFFYQANAGIGTLIFGGMVIFPLSVLICKLLGYSGKHKSDNPLGPLALEGTFWMLLSIPIAIGAAAYKLEWFFPAMLLVIAGRYLTFCTLYGNKVFWLFGIMLAVSSFILVGLNAPVFIGGITGGLVELVFALLIYLKMKSEKVS